MILVTLFYKHCIMIGFASAVSAAPVSAAVVAADAYVH